MKTSQRLTGFATRASRHGRRSGMKGPDMDRFLECCDRGFEQGTYALLWLIVALMLMLIDSQVFKYVERVYAG